VQRRCRRSVGLLSFCIGIGLEKGNEAGTIWKMNVRRSEWFGNDALRAFRGAMMGACLLGLLAGLGACRTKPEMGNIEGRMLTAIAQAMDRNYSPGAEPSPLTVKEQEQLRAIEIYDSPMGAPPRYFDRVVSVERRQVERTYLSPRGEIMGKEVVTLSEEEFWRPLRVLAQYRTRYLMLPAGTRFYPNMVEAGLPKK
jgi:hypothetical protein